MQVLLLTLSMESIVFTPPLPSAQCMNISFEIKTKPVIQAATIVAVVAFSSRFLATIAAYTQSLTFGINCVVVLAVTVCLVLWFLPFLYIYMYNIYKCIYILSP